MRKIKPTVVTEVFRALAVGPKRPARMCPLCGEKSKVLRTVDRADGGTVRYRVCRNMQCRYRFVTEERRLSPI